MTRVHLIAIGTACLTACAPSPGDPSDGDGTTGAQSTDDGASPATASTPSGSVSGPPTGVSTSSGGSESSDGSSTTGEPAPYETDIEWAPCPLYTGGEGLEAECATVPVPADWSEVDGATLDLFVKRIGAMQGDKQLWMLMGGPGGSARSFEFAADTYIDFDDGLTVYLLDHRGTGRSTMLACPEQEAAASEEGRLVTLDETPACVADLEATYGELLPQFTTSNAARDLGWFIDNTRAEEAVHVFGSSYGTYWAQRYLQIFPDQADSTTLLGITHPTFSFTRSDVAYNGAGEALMDACGEDAFCSARLGPDPVASMAAIFDMLDDGHCAEAGLSRATVRTYLSSLLSWGGNERARIPATLYRLQRCDAADVAALQRAAPLMADPLGALFNDPYFSVAINRHVSFSEMWEAPFPTEAEVAAWETELLFSLSSSSDRYEVFDLWPTYPEPPLDDMLADTDIPMLMLNGEFDPNTPTQGSGMVAEHFSAENQRYHVIPGGNHGWFSPTTDGYGCAETIFFNFIQDPSAPLFDCLDLVQPINWAGSSADAQAFFGTEDLYD